MSPKNNSKFSEWRVDNENTFPTPEEYVGFYSEDIIVSWDISSEEFDEVSKIYIWITRNDAEEPKDWFT